MSSPDVPGLPGNELNAEDDAVFDELARRAGAALRRPAPEDGVSVIAHRRRRQQALKATVVGAVAVASLIGTLVVVSTRDDPDSLRPVDSSPATLPATTTPVPTATASLPVDPSATTLPATTTPAPSTTPAAPSPPAPAQSLWVELEPGATAPLPPAPIPDIGAALVWTGTELIVWGSYADDLPQDGAAFDPAAGTWRQIAPPPDGVRPGVMLWTGTELLVWSNRNPDTVSAAYDPANDTWRLIADPPVPAEDALWIGDAAVVLPDRDVDNDGFVESPSLPSFAYHPATDEWRRLADGPWGLPIGWVSGRSTRAVWTGTTIITLNDTDLRSITPDSGVPLNGYDPATDSWRVLEGLDSASQPVVIPGRGGASATVAFLPLEQGSPVELFDDRGNAIGELAGRPAELASCETNPGTGCLLTSLRGVSVGGEVLFWLSEDGWAFDPEAQTWRSLPLDGRQPGWDGTEVVAAGDLMFAWGDDRDGLVYRAATPG
jgi:hypothetical protein